MKKKFFAAAALAVLAALFAGAAVAADYPTKPITLLCGYPAGGSSDLLCRILANSLQEKIGQPVVVENVTGGGGWLCWMEMIRNRAADGYTFCLVNTPNFNMGKYDTANPREYDITALDLLCNEVSDYNVIAIKADETRYTDLPSLIEYAKANDMLVGASATGIMNDDSTIVERLNKTFGTKIDVVVTKGSKDNETFLLNGSTDMLVGNISDVLTGMKAGTFKVVAVFAPERVSLIPDVPTCRELTGEDIVGSSSRGYAFPHGVDAEIRAKFYAALVEAVKDPETIKALEGIGAVTNFVPQEEYVKFMENDIAIAKGIFGIE